MILGELQSYCPNSCFRIDRNHRDVIGNYGVAKREIPVAVTQDARLSAL